VQDRTRVSVTVGCRNQCCSNRSIQFRDRAVEPFETLAPSGVVVAAVRQAGDGRLSHVGQMVVDPLSSAVQPVRQTDRLPRRYRSRAGCQSRVSLSVLLQNPSAVDLLSTSSSSEDNSSVVRQPWACEFQIITLSVSDWVVLSRRATYRACSQHWPLAYLSDSV